ncbi:MAG TPA: hypothetical protein VKQ08_11235 [Cyclobacteriaceae bacterium]|nr:hypothetical protein [Cyclobacteriaceae bacterium]
MTLSEFKASLELANAPMGIDPFLLALWREAKGDWEKAHGIVQEVDHPDGAWIHAYLHRKEGDEFNAKFWYNLAGRKFPMSSFAEEWDEIVTYFLSR